MNCPQCDIELEAVESCNYRGLIWNMYECPVCDYCCTEEPDWDNVPEGYYD
jgi:hypothetical protein